jgi:hypothetical protein
LADKYKVCSNCKFFAALPVEKVCTRYPPVPLVKDSMLEARTVWPKPLPTDTCGEWIDVKVP